MKVGIMQPYFMPYIGYWQLINAVDKYVIYDDVNFIGGGWINRNRILNNGKVQYINIQMQGASNLKHINLVGHELDGHLTKKNEKTLYAAYRKAPEFENIYPFLLDILEYQEVNLAIFLKHSIFKVMEYLNIKTEIFISSELPKDNLLKGEEKVINICKCLDGNKYYNAINGEKLYDYNRFKEKGIELCFLETSCKEYKQNTETFHSHLSIIDVLMYNSKERVKEMLNQYKLIRAK